MLAIPIAIVTIKEIAIITQQSITTTRKLAYKKAHRNNKTQETLPIVIQIRIKIQIDKKINITILINKN